jgi:aspartyl-tRNA(Asn)/glutamyl-tRNA(Gln) amidotransferase subunit A
MYLADIFTCPINLAGLPGLTIPCALDSANLPIGLQLIGPPFSEASILKTGNIFSKEIEIDFNIMTTKSF